MSNQTNLFPPPLRGSSLPDALQKYLITLQMLLPLVTVDTTGGSVVIPLPPAGLNVATGQSNQNMEITYRKTSADANTVTITGSADGAQVLTSNIGAASRVRLKSDGYRWWVTG